MSKEEITPPETEGASQAQTAYRVLEEMIVTLKLPPGSKISEKALNRTLGLGRTPLREALQRLAIEGTVTIRPRSGVIVSAIELEDQLGMIEVRRELEKIIAGRAARLANDAERSRFSQLALDFARAGDTDDVDVFIATDREFNTLITATANNKYSAYAIAPIEAQTRRFWYLYFERFGDLPRVAALHAAICRVVAASDEPGARAASDRLLDYVDQYTRKTLHAMGVL